MPEKVKQSADGTDLVVELRRQAMGIAAATLEKHSPLKGKDAHTLGRLIVEQVGPKLRAEQVAAISGMTVRQVWAIAGTAVTLLALDLVVMRHAAQHGSRPVRAAALAAIAVRLAASGYAHRKEARVRASCRKIAAGVRP